MEVPLNYAKKPVDRWLGLSGIATGIAFYLLPKTSLVVLCSLALILGLLIHPIWNFWWVEKAIWRRLGALSLFVAFLALLGYFSWPPSQPHEISKQPKAAFRETEARTISQ